MRQVIRLVAALVLATGALVTPGTPASAQTGSFTIGNGASFETPVVPWGAHLVMYTDDPVSTMDQPLPYDQDPPDGMWIKASCSALDGMLMLPISYIGPAFTGNQINFYLPDSTGGEEPWGPCLYAGDKIRFIVHAANNLGGFEMTKELDSTNAHPGIFYTTGNIPVGDWINPMMMFPNVSLSECANRLPQEPGICRAKILAPAAFTLMLTGGEAFVSNPSALIFQLATADRGVRTGGWVDQTTASVARGQFGVQHARVRLAWDTTGGEYLLRARTLIGTQSIQELTVEFGQAM